ncbi:MAG: cytochrome c [Rhizobiales bacterium]|nr:cytochrome c [Hyphomicrobiales bacterium]
MMMAPGHKDNLRGLSEGQISTLARFISVGQLNFAAMVIDGKSVGAPLSGKDIFEGACISCHQADGKAYFQGEDGDRSSLGWVTNNRPSQALHKIINGVPSADMLSLRFLPQDRLADLLAYLQTLDDDAE